MKPEQIIENSRRNFVNNNRGFNIPPVDTRDIIGAIYDVGLAILAKMDEYKRSEKPKKTLPYR